MQFSDPLQLFFSGLISGTIVNAFDDETHHHNLSNKSNLKEKNEPFKDRLLSGLKYGFINLPGDIAIPLVQGLFVAAMISIFLPPDFVAEYFVSSQYLAYFAMLLISLPMYVCATASIPIALALMGKGVTAGAVFIFLMAGPATNAATIEIGIDTAITTVDCHDLKNINRIIMASTPPIHIFC